MFKQLYYHGEIPYLIIRIIPKHNFTKIKEEKLNDALRLWKENLRADHILQNSQSYLFVEYVDEAEEIIEENLLKENESLQEIN